jgi:hypothetical protein
MPGPTGASAVPAGRTRTLAQAYRHFGEVDAAGTSPLYERVAVAISESGEALRAIEAASACKRPPTVILAALHDLTLAGRAPALAAAYAAADGEAAAGAAICDSGRLAMSTMATSGWRSASPGRRRCGAPGQVALNGWGDGTTGWSCPPRSSRACQSIKRKLSARGGWVISETRVILAEKD